MYSFKSGMMEGFTVPKKFLIGCFLNLSPCADASLPSLSVQCSKFPLFFLEKVTSGAVDEWTNLNPRRAMPAVMVIMSG